jgi:iron complex outermembrane receptor protein
MRSARPGITAALIAATAFGARAWAQEAVHPPRGEPLPPERAGQLSLEELMSINVTSVAGVEQQVLRSPAAIDVITGEDLRRLGIRHIADALRAVPGVFVGQVNSHSWSIAPRGFNGGLANKTLVLMDGRRLYDPLFGGTYWELQDTLLEDVDRVEVVRGPGATLWGASAVNGVINIVTKRTDQTQGLFLEGGAGTLERDFGSFRYGGRFAEDAYYSVWGTYFQRDSLEVSGPDDGHDRWDLGHGRFRTDLRLDPTTWLTMEAEAYSSFDYIDRASVPVPAPIPTLVPTNFDTRVRGGHALAKLERMESPAEGWSVLGYYDRTFRDQTGFRETRNTFDISGRYLFRLGDSHALVTGLEYYVSADDTHPSARLEVDPGSETHDTISGFIQDTITLAPDRWFAMLGTKLEHNDQTGFEVQPSARLWFTPDERQTFWGAVSRAVRTPTRLEEDVAATLAFADPGLLSGGPPSGPVPLQFFGSDDLKPETLVAYELGYRNRLTPRVSVDLAAFYNDYDNLISLPRSLVGGRFTNSGAAESDGAEIALDWRVAENWRLRASYSYTDINIRGPIDDSDEGNTPHNMASLRSYLAITDQLEFNSAGYYVDRLPTPDVDDYFRLDLGITWHASRTTDVALWGQNLLDQSHREFTDRELERGVYFVAQFRF